MRKTILLYFLFFLTILFYNQLFAQKFYLIFSSGYSLKYQAQPIDWSYYSIDDNGWLYQKNLIKFEKYNTISAQQSTIERKEVSLGQGTHIQTGVGFKVNKVISFELNCNYLSSYNFKVDNYYSENNYYNQALSGSMLYLVPTIKFMYEIKRITPYLGLGYNFGFGSFTHSVHQVTNYSIIQDIETQRKFHGGFAEGITSNLGSYIKISNHFSALVELIIANIKYSPSKTLVVKYVVNSRDELSNMQLSEKQIEFVDKISYNTSIISDTPSQSLKVSMPFSSIGLNLGFIYKFK